MFNRRQFMRLFGFGVVAAAPVIASAAEDIESTSLPVPTPEPLPTDKLLPHQQQFLNCTAKHKLFAGGRGAGKTYVGSLDLVNRAEPNCEYLVVAPTYGMGHDSWNHVLKHATNQGVLDFCKASDRLIVLKNGAKIRFSSFESTGGHNELKGVWYDESGYMNPQPFIPSEWSTFTFTPNGKTYTKVVDGEPVTLETWMWKLAQRYPDSTFHARSIDNSFLSEDFIARVAGAFSHVEYSQEINGQFLEEV